MLSIGLLNLLRADRLVVPIYHEAKAGILNTLMTGGAADPAIPATWLTLHGRATLITTQALAERACVSGDAVEINTKYDLKGKLGLPYV